MVLDGTIGDDWIVELEARTLKQVRGVIVDLLLHKRTKKMLVVLVESKPTSAMTGETVEAHLYHAVNELRGRLNLAIQEWCIIGLTRNHKPPGGLERDEHLRILRDRFVDAGILTE